MDNHNLGELLEKIEYYELKEKQRKQQHNQYCYNYRNKHLEEMKSYAKKKAKEYYDMKKNDPDYLEKKRISSLKSLHNKKLKCNHDISVSV